MSARTATTGSQDALLTLVQQQQARITRFALIQLSALALIVFALANAFEKINVSRLDAAIADITVLSSITEKSLASLSADPAAEFFLLGQLVQSGDSRAPYGDAECKRARELLASQAPTDRRSGTLEREPIPACVPLTDGEKDTLGGLQQQLADSVRDSYRDAFTVELNLGLAKTELDLRHWLAILPFALILSQLYLSILRRQHRLLIHLAGTRPFDDEAAQGSPPVRRLMFTAEGRGSAFLRYPARLSETFYVVATIGLLTYLYVVAGGVTDSVDGLVITLSVAITLACAFYALAYYQHVSTLLNRHLQRSVNLPAPPDLSVQLWQGARRITRSIFHKFPRRLVCVGNVLIACSLMLPMSTVGCEYTATGAEFLANAATTGDMIKHDDALQKKALWLPAFRMLLLHAVQDEERTSQDEEVERAGFMAAIAEQFGGRVVYGVLLLLAGASMLWLLAELLRSWFEWDLLQRLTAFTGLRAVAGTMLCAARGAATYIAVDVSFFMCGPVAKAIVMLGLWGIPLLLSLPLAHGSFGGRRRHNRLRRWARVLTAPIAPLSLLVIAQFCYDAAVAEPDPFFRNPEPLLGLLALALGSIFLAAGLRGLAYPVPAR